MRRAASMVALVLLWLANLSPFRQSASADELILRDWTRLAEVTVTRFDEDGVTLEDGRQFGWGQIESGEVSDDEQAAFDQLVHELGEPLFRLRQRLRLGDDDQVLELARSLWPRFRDRSGETALIVSSGFARGLIAAGRREEAVLPYQVFLHGLLVRDEATAINEALAEQAQREFGLLIDAPTGLCRNLLPIWQDRQAAESALPHLLAWLATDPSPVPPSTHVYVASLAAFSGDSETAQRQQAAIPLATDALIELRTVIEWQLELQQDPAMSIRSIESNLDKLLPVNQAIALYWLGVAGLQGNNEVRQQTALLQLLRIPAELSGESDAAAAALHRVVEFFGSPVAGALGADQQAIVRAELLRAYPNSWFAEQERER